MLSASDSEERREWTQFFNDRQDEMIAASYSAQPSQLMELREDFPSPEQSKVTGAQGSTIADEHHTYEAGRSSDIDVDPHCSGTPQREPQRDRARAPTQELAAQGADLSTTQRACRVSRASSGSRISRVSVSRVSSQSSDGHRKSRSRSASDPTAYAAAPSSCCDSAVVTAAAAAAVEASTDRRSFPPATDTESRLSVLAEPDARKQLAEAAVELLHLYLGLLPDNNSSLSLNWQLAVTTKDVIVENTKVAGSKWQAFRAKMTMAASRERILSFLKDAKRTGESDENFHHLEASGFSFSPFFSFSLLFLPVFWSVERPGICSD